MKTKLELVSDVTLCPSSNKMCFSSHNKSIYLIDPYNDPDVNSAIVLKGHCKDVMSVHWNPVYNVILSGSEDEFIRLWDATKTEEIHSL